MKYYKGQIGCSLTTFRVKKPKGKKKEQMSKQKIFQKQRIERENELYEMIQLPNGDFKKVKRTIPIN